MDDLTLLEVSWLIEGNIENKKDYYEMISYAVKNAIVSTNKGKDLRLFDDTRKHEEQKVTQESRALELDALEKTFGTLE